MAGGLLLLAGLAELGLLLVLLAAFLAHSLRVVTATLPTGHRLVQLRRDVLRAAEGEVRLASPTSRRDSQLYRQAFEELATSVSGEGAERIERLAREMGLSDQAARWCQSRLWWHRLRGVRFFDHIGGGNDLVPARLGDEHPVVRAAAARWAAHHPSAAAAEHLVAMLDDPDRHCRLVAQDGLIRLGAVATEPLAAYLDRGETPGKALALALAAATGLADARFLWPGLRAAGDSDPGVRAQAATLLAAVAGKRAEQGLLGLLHDPIDPVRVAATRGLGVVSSWALAPHLAGALGDRAWEVRREAALALRRLGPAGRLYLRRALTDPDPYAADMARQVLDLPDRAVGSLGSPP